MNVVLKITPEQFDEFLLFGQTFTFIDNDGNQTHIPLSQVFNSDDDTIDLFKHKLLSGDYQE